MPATSPHGPVLDDRALNRALLARQHLSTRRDAPPLDEVRHLVGLQSQVPASPHRGLWSRLEAFTTDALDAALEDRSVVRLATLRGTVHLVAADDAFELAAHARPALATYLRARNQHGTALAEVDLDDLSMEAEDLLAEPRTSVDLGQLLGARWPAVDPKHLAYGARCLLPLVQVPPRGLWGASGPGTTTTWTTADAWLGRSRHDLDPVAHATDPDAVLAARARLVRRYLAAFGPATVADVQQWSGLTRLRAAVDVLRPELVTFTGPGGAELFDLADAQRPNASEPVPVLLVADFDNVLLSHKDRTRVLGDLPVSRIVTVNGQVPATVLVDGRVAGSWTWRTTGDGTAQLEVAPLRSTTTGDATHPSPADALGTADVVDEIVARGEDWLRVAAPGATPRVVVRN
ncbi:AlkZ family DNA glycosylase [Cellulosimicrobium terreum]|nr:AlkZ family DNA glycosylase [Cellulosimicrobium terreum]